MRKFVLIIAAAMVLGGCSNAPTADRALMQVGFSNIQIT